MKEEEIKEMSKAEWKKKVVEGLEKEVKEEVEGKIKEMKKLRFVGEYKRKEYVGCEMAVVRDVMRMRLNMVDVKANFKGKYKDLLCVACKEAEETTEHVLQCDEYRRLTGHNLTFESPEKMMEMEWLKQASNVCRRIEETRRWLL